MILAGRTQPLQYDTLEQRCSAVRDIGFRAVEICFDKQDWSLFDIATLDIHRLKDCIAECGFESFSTSLHTDFIFDDERYNATLQGVKKSGELCSPVYIISGAAKRTGDWQEWNRMAQRVERIVKQAEDVGVVVAVEFEPNFVVGTTVELQRLFAQIPSPALAANADLGHLFLCDPDPLQSIAELGDKIVHCHIENMAAGVHDHLPPFPHGDMDLARYIGALKAIGFRGPLALDLYKGDYAGIGRQTIAYLSPMLQGGTTD